MFKKSILYVSCFASKNPKKLVLFLFAISTFLVVVSLVNLSEEIVIKNSLKDAELYSKTLAEFRTLYTSEVVANVAKSGIEITHDYKNKENAIPLPATLGMMLGNEIAKHSDGGGAKLYSPYPFPWRSSEGGLRDQFSKNAWRALSERPDVPYYEFVEQNGQYTLRYAVADVMRAKCIQCHNSHADSPKHDWQVGQLRGVLEVSRPLAPVVAGAKDEVFKTSMIVVSIIVTIFFLLFLVFDRLRSTSAQLKKATEYAENILHSIGDILFVVDTNGNITKANKTARETLGYSRSELFQMNIRDLIVAECGDVLIERIETGEIDEADVDFIEKSESIVPTNLSMSPIYNENQEREGAIVIAKDARESKLIRELRRREVQLSESIREVSAAKNTAEKANDAKSVFLANMSHEIRTPLNGIIGLVDILKRSELSEKQCGQLDVIYQSGEHLLSVINDILEFSKIESGNLAVESVEFDLIDCIESSCQIMAPSVYRKNLDFLMYIDRNTPQKIISDAARIRQLLVNFLGNAIKYTPAGHVSLSVYSTYSDDSKMTSIVVEIADTGVGIPEHKIDNIFKAFAQTDESDTRKYGGTGLGLTISKEIVDAMNGSIEVESEEAKGSIFRFKIPVKISQESNQQDCSPLSFEYPVIVASKNSCFRHNLNRYMEGSQGGCYEASSFQKSLDLIDTFPNDVAGVLVIEKSLLEEKISEFFSILDSGDRLKKWFIILLTYPSDEFLLEDVGADRSVVLLSCPPKRDMLLRLIGERKKTPVKQGGQNANKYQIQTNSTYRVLLVEDNKVNQMVATLMVESNGHKVVIANNGEEAFTKMTSGEKFDLILMDCQMPVMDGYEATRKIRAWEIEENLKKTPIIAMTANAFKKIKEECFECGMDGFVTKPVETDILMEAIDSTFSRLKREVA